MPTYTRKMSPIERFHAAHGICAPTTDRNVIAIIEGSGTITLDELKRAVTKAVETNPGASLALTGHLWWTKWVVNQPPAVNEYIGDINLNSNENMDFLYNQWDFRNGPTFEFLLNRTGDKTYVIARAPHAVMDAMGMDAFIQDVFSCLRGEAPVGHPSTELDIDLSKRASAGKPIQKSPNAAPCAVLATGQRAGQFDGKCLWRRITINKKTSYFLPKLMMAIASHAWEKDQGMVRMGMPVDLRRHDRSIRSTGNLTSMLVIELNPGDTVKTIRRQLHKNLKENADLINPSLSMLRLLPMAILARLTHNKCYRELSNNNRTSMTAMLTDIGKVSLKNYSTDNFTAEAFVPIPTPPYYMMTASIEHDNGVDIVIAMPNMFGADKLDKLLNHIEKCISQPELLEQLTEEFQSSPGTIEKCNTSPALT